LFLSTSTGIPELGSLRLVPRGDFLLFPLNGKGVVKSLALSSSPPIPGIEMGFDGEPRSVTVVPLATLLFIFTMTE
jgi:hypothetical protein